MQNHIVIMAGGIGSRFWPMSTPEYPKQFIDVMGVGKSLIQLTVERFKDICPKENFWVVTSERYVDIVKEQLPQIPAQHILAEPEARNTAPCIAYACWKIRKEFPQANIVVTPSDALVIDTAEFARCIAVALEKTADSQAIVTLGMKPTRPETGYGTSLLGGKRTQRGSARWRRSGRNRTWKRQRGIWLREIISGTRGFLCGTRTRLRMPYAGMRRRLRE